MIDITSPVGPAGPVQRGRSRTGTTGFALAAEPAPAEAAATAEVAEPTAVAGLGAMLALQETGASTVRDREARRRGQALLTALAALHRALLTGAGMVSPTALQELAGLAHQVPEAADPVLAAIVSGIVVRARVELARLECTR